jgi:hypothetical protein
MEYKKFTLEQLEEFWESLEKIPEPKNTIVCWTGYEGAINLVECYYKYFNKELTREQLERIVSTIPNYNGAYDSDVILRSL